LCKCCSRPDPRYAGAPLDRFVGRDVKIAFGPRDAPGENMWVKVAGVAGERLVGPLTSKPVLLRTIRAGDRVELARTQIIDVKPPLFGNRMTCEHRTPERIRAVPEEPEPDGSHPTCAPAPVVLPTVWFEARCNLWNL
jgi:hypothetical protein